jgi:methyl-accepting chemotaxis protein
MISAAYRTGAHIDEMTRQNAALAEESSASAMALTNQIRRLNAPVAQFETGNEPSLDNTAQEHRRPAARKAA